MAPTKKHVDKIEPLTKEQVEGMVDRADKYIDECPDFDETYDIADSLTILASDWYRLKAKENDRAGGPVYHGQDVEAAKERAKRIKGLVVRSIGPNRSVRDPDAEKGFWSDSADSMVRVWEVIEFNYSKKAKKEED
jgi:hypothetical protein